MNKNLKKLKKLKEERDDISYALIDADDYSYDELQSRLTEIEMQIDNLENGENNEIC